jgi:hypothetical protein
VATNIGIDRVGSLEYGEMGGPLGVRLICEQLIKKNDMYCNTVVSFGGK